MRPLFGRCCHGRRQGEVPVATKRRRAAELDGRAHAAIVISVRNVRGWLLPLDARRVVPAFAVGHRVLLLLLLGAVVGSDGVAVGALV